MHFCFAPAYISDFTNIQLLRLLLRLCNTVTCVTGLRFKPCLWYDSLIGVVFKMPFRKQTLVACLMSLQRVTISQGRICENDCTCCHTEIEVTDQTCCCHIETEVTDQTFYLTQSRYADTGPASPSADPITPGAWQSSHWRANV